MSAMIESAPMPLDVTAPRSDAGLPPLDIAIHRDPDAARATWLALAADGSATPYQRPGWIQAYVRTMPAAQAGLPVAVASDAAGPLMVLPLLVSATGVLRVARIPGGKHANFQMPVFSSRAASVPAPAWADALSRLARELGADAIRFDHMPLEWEGLKNPLAALGGRPSPSMGHKIALGPDDEAVIRGILSKDTRKKLRKKREHLAALGPLSFGRMASEADCAAVLDAFFSFKAQRMAELGIDNPFATADMVDFITSACRDGLTDGAPVIELYALRAGERVLALMGGVCDGRRFSGMFNAFDPAPEVSRWSPGDNLLHDMVRALCQRGLATLDLGIGEAHYKRVFCDGVEPVVDLIVPATVKGRLYRDGFYATRAVKARIKASPRARALAAKFGRRISG